MIESKELKNKKSRVKIFLNYFRKKYDIAKKYDKELRAKKYKKVMANIKQRRLKDLQSYAAGKAA